jgi:23S rRNA (cytidine1920-2'-O)/16S rRNA (cytidine1409-2'-O)-methyltransferase
MTASRESRRERLDVLLVERGLVDTRARARALIMAGRVRSGQTRLDKPGARLAPDAPLSVEPGPRYVSRGGFKLTGALDAFEVRVGGRDAVDVGASTGGFTQVLLERGASRVIALDVGKGQLDWSLRTDPRVVVIEGTNARHLEPEHLPFVPDLAVVDVSFISVTRILPALRRCLTPPCDVVSLVKPQFEVGKGRVGRGGIVKDVEAHREVLGTVSSFAMTQGWSARGIARSSIRGAEGNVEFFLHLDLSGRGLRGDDLDLAIGAALIPRGDEGAS